MADFNQFTIPFGKFIDPNTLGGLELIKNEVIEENLPLMDELYLVRDAASGTFYAAYEPETDEPNYHGSIAEEIMLKFVKAELGDGATVELLRPKNDDWLPTHYLARVHLAK